MSELVRILTADLDHARAARPELSHDELIAEACRRGVRIAADDGRSTGSEDAGRSRMESLRARCAASAASVAELRSLLVTDRERFAGSVVAEREAFLNYVGLDRDVVPPLKLEAQRLRAELRRLEGQATAAGVDLSTIEPSIDWPGTLAVDAYERPQYVSNESRRHAAVAYFRKRDQA